MNARIGASLIYGPAGERAPMLNHLARRHAEALMMLGVVPRPEEPATDTRRRERHRRELAQLQALGRRFGLTVRGVPDA